MKKYVNCIMCNGSGHGLGPDGELRPCYWCKGFGVEVIYKRDEKGRFCK